MKSPLQKAALLLPQRLAQQGAELTASEQTLAQTLGSDYPHALLESATALAARTGTSASTVVRLFAKLGYASYAEAQREARGEVTALLQTAAQRAPVLLGAQRSLSECVDDALLHDQHNIQSTREGLDMAAFEVMARQLAQEEGRVFVLAQLNSSPVSAWLALHLNMCRPGVQQLDAGAIAPADQLLWVGPSDTLLAFSVSQYSRGTYEVAQRFSEAGARVLAITDSPTAPLATVAHHWLQVRTANASPFHSYTAAFYLCNALVSAVAQLRHADVSEALARRDALWREFNHQLIRTPEPRGPARAARKPPARRSST
ncbi:MurR/RpiR family transcriptional regulator [Delftia tsuruhatensis]|uniref:MurR/RpiR family transcriptional regulator n=1 Tax=Delftia tsuruhatensis TaxID=180282 RepID=UPI002260E23E|nr:MurR/RpiR family transcriptional regulator [Delftia tsuruhatensis]MCX7505185.1 MurR/RpiR family transcriptional regulator [Delftia tsuruhatensis]MDH0772256.1 MurR/RpiR family transcriptional regulator [Delftia tsuruhatensis]MDH1456224.1 MurR/RpiR family transcriptional regulator [Delftia tsuruhatensis]MDH1825118.1 MurR/RpiR family transcriptional regulator [Delftia tsuruhatensis]WGG10296.1 MurR/RpiR family transcriptional regulator [Delftia tsuruhatensis]